MDETWDEPCGICGRRPVVTLAKLYALPTLTEHDSYLLLCADHSPGGAQAR